MKTTFAFWSGATATGVTRRLRSLTVVPASDIDIASAVQRMRPAIRAFARRRLSGADADELVQDVTLLLVEALREGRVKELSALGSFTLGLCRNVVRDRARVAQRRAELWERYGPLEEPSHEGPGSQVLFNRGVLEDCLAQLTQRTRAVLKQAYVEDAPNPEIATALSLSEGNVRVIRHRALSQLRECLDKPLVWSTP